MPDNIESFSRPYSKKEIDQEIRGGLNEYTDGQSTDIDNVLHRLRQNLDTHPSIDQNPHVSEEKLSHIDVNEWQKHAHEAFEKGEYDKILILRKIKPEVTLDTELVKHRLQEIMAELKRGWDSDIQKIIKLSDARLTGEHNIPSLLRLCDAKIEKGITFDSKLSLYKEVFGSFDIESIKKHLLDFICLKNEYYKMINVQVLLDETDITFTSEDILSRFGESRMIDGLKWMRSLKVPLSHPDAQELYVAYYKKNRSISKSLSDLIAEVPDENTIKKIVLHNISSASGNNVHWQSVDELIKQYPLPEIRPEEIEEFYIDALFSFAISQQNTFPLIEILHVKPSETILNNVLTHIYLNNNQSLERKKLGIIKLSNLLQRELSLPLEEVQHLYRTIITNGSPHRLIETYELSGIKPQIEHDRATDYMVSRLKNYDSNVIKRLQEIFEISIEPSGEKRNELYEQLSQSGDIVALERFAELHNEQIPQQYIETCAQTLLEQYIEHIQKYNQPNKHLIDFIQKYNIVFSDTLIQTSYRALIDRDFSYQRMMLLQSVFGHIPDDMTDAVYHHLLDNIAENNNAFSNVQFLIEFRSKTNRKAHFTRDQMHQLYVSVLKNMYAPTIYKDLESLCQDTFVWTYDEVKLLALRLISHSDLRSMSQLTELTGIDISSDTEVHEAYQLRFQKELDDLRISQGKNVSMLSIKRLIDLDKSLVSSAKIQDLYQVIISQDKNWESQLESIHAATGVDVQLTTEELRAKALIEIAKGNVEALGILQSIGSFELTKDEVLIGYEYLVERNVPFEWLQKYKNLTGVTPTSDQISTYIGKNILNDYNAKSLLERFNKEFGIDQITASSIFGYCLRNYDMTNAKVLVTMQLVSQESVQDVLRAEVTNIIRSESFGLLAQYKKHFPDWRLPCDQEAVHYAYKKICSLELKSKQVDILELLYNTTGIRPEFDEAELQQFHEQSIIEGTSKRFCAVTGTRPTQEIVKKATKDLAENGIDFSDAKYMVGHLNSSPESRSILRVEYIFHALRTFTAPIDGFMRELEESAKNEYLGLFEKELVASLYTYEPTNFTAYFIKDSIKNLGTYLGKKIDIPQGAINTVMRTEILHLLKKEKYDSQFSLKQNVKLLQQFFEKEYNPPTYSGISELYLSLLQDGKAYTVHKTYHNEEKEFALIDDLADVSSRLDPPPSLEYIIELAKKTYRPAIAKQLPSLIHNMCKEAISRQKFYDLFKIQEVLSYTYNPEPQEIQETYAYLLLSNYGKKKELYDKLVLQTGILPDTSIVDAFYDKKMHEPAGLRGLTLLRSVYDIVHVLPNEEIAQKIYNDILYRHLTSNYDNDENSDSNYKKDIDEIVEFTGIKPIFSQAAITQALDSSIDDSPKINRIILFAHTQGILPSHISELFSRFHINSIEDRENFLAKQSAYTRYICMDPERKTLLSGEIVDQANKLHLNYLELELLLQSGLNITEYIANDKHEALYEQLVKYVPDWRDGGFADMFKEGADIFGYTRMWAYSNKPNVSRHDALHSMPNIINMLKSSELTSDQFYGNILKQVHLDDSIYPEGTAHRHFNAIVNSFNFNIESVLNMASEFTEIHTLQALLQNFDSPKAVFNSWNSLKKYVEIAIQLEKKDAFDQLIELKNQGHMQAFYYYETLLFHPDSKVSISEVIKLMRDPESFLAGSATHTPEEIHNAKKPSNYLYINNLDLTAPELRDGLVEGKLDMLQVFPPMEITYSIPVIRGVPYRSFNEVISYAVGSRSRGIEGSANNPKALLKRVMQICKNNNIVLDDYLQGKVTVDSSTQTQLEEALYDSSIGISRKTVEWQTYIAKICNKSDPHAIIAGNDTAGCDPFGDGKKTVYTFNMNTNQFTIQAARNEQGKQMLKTVAQSTITKDINIHRKVPSLIKDPSVREGKIVDALPEELTHSQTALLACDNIEVAANYRDAAKRRIIEMLYEGFMKEYLNRYGEASNLFTDQFIVGCEGYDGGYAQSTSWPTAANTYAPQAPVSYSDKNGEHVKIVSLGEIKDIERKEIHVPDISRESDKEYVFATNGIQFLTFEDTMKVAWLEGKLFADNQALVFGLHAAENALMAKDINNAIKKRPNLSVKYVSTDGITQGYMIAYEGRVGAGRPSYDREHSDPVIYITDVAAPKNSMTGGRLMQGFIELYVANYLQKGILIPILAEARESTSYRLVQRQLQKIGEKLDIEFDLEEEGSEATSETDHSDSERMHTIIIRPRLKQNQSKRT